MAHYNEPNSTFCSTCGQELDPNASFCSSCGAAVGRAENIESVGPTYVPGMPSQADPSYVAHPAVPSHLTRAIISTIFSLLCCGVLGCIPGVVSIVFAAQVDGKLSSGDYAGAVNASNSAGTWSTVAIFLGAVGAAIYVIALIALFMLGGIAGILGNL